MGPNGACVARPGRWQNPIGIDRWEFPMEGVPHWSVTVAATHKVICRVETREEAVALALRAFRLYARLRLLREQYWLDPLRGKDLYCFCPEGQPCHGDILLELANR